MDRVCSICGNKVGRLDGPYVTIETVIICHGELFWSEQDRIIKTKTYYCKKCWEKHNEFLEE